MKKSKKIILTLAVIVVALVLLAGNECYYTVNEDEYANTLRFSKTVKTEDEAGIYLKIPFIETVQKFPKKVLLYDMKPSEVLTKDSKSMIVDNYVLWKITDPLTFYKTLGTEAEAETRIDMLTYNAIKTEMGKNNQEAIINQDDNSRNVFNSNILKAASGETQAYGIEIIDIKIKKLDLPADNEAAVYRRMISERNKMSEQLRAEGTREAELIRNDVDKQKNILISNAKASAEQIIAEGEAEYMRILSEAYNTPDKQEFYKFVRGLDAIEVSLTDGNATVILGKDSALAMALTNP